MELIAQEHPPARHLHREAFENAARVVAATGGSTNAALHLPAMAHEAGIEFDLFDVAEIFKTTPYIADLKPGGKYVAKDMFEAGGVPLLMKTLLDGGFLHGDCLTVTGKTLAENIERCCTGTPTRRSSVRRQHADHPTGGVVGLQGHPRARRRDREGRGHAELQVRGPARVFDCEEECFAAVDAAATTRKARCSSSATRAPRAGPACARCCRPPPRSTARAWARRSR